MTNLKKNIFKLALPSIIENILQIMLSTVDTFFVSTISLVAISAVGVNNLISNLYLTFFIAIGTGVSIMTARADGEQNITKVNASIRNALLLTLLLSIFFFFVNFTFGETLLTYLAKDNVLIEQSYVYFAAVILPISFMSFMQVISALLKSLGDTRSPMLTAFMINIINIILDYLLIVGIGQFKGLGILGAGLATTISRFIGCLILIYYLNQRTSFLKSFRFRFSDNVNEMIRYAIPVGIEKIVMRVGQLFYGSLIVTIGIKHYTGHNIAGTIEGYSYLPAMGYGVAAFTIIGHKIGEGNYKDIRRVGNLAFKYSTLLMMIIGLFFFLFAPNLASIFTDDPYIINLVTIVLRIIALFQPFLCATQVIASSLQALGDVKYPLYLTAFGIWCIRILGTYVFGLKLGYGLVGVWISYAIDVTFRGTLLWFRFIKKTKSVELMKEAYDESSK